MLRSLGRRHLLLGSLFLQGCAAKLTALTDPASTAEAQALLAETAAAHGAAALADIRDISVGYAGTFHFLVGKIQPVLVDAGFRGASEERLLLGEGLIAQAHTGPLGHKQVVRHAATGKPGDVRVWFNGNETQDAEKRAAAAMVADDYALFLLGPMLLARYWSSQRDAVMAVGEPERLTAGGTLCDVLRVRLSPGLGFSDGDQLALFIDRDERLMRRVRFSVNGMESTRGAVAEVDLFDHVARHGIRWPTRFRENLLRPAPLPVHDWRLTGLEVNRGFTSADISGASFGDRAIAKAEVLGS